MRARALATLRDLAAEGRVQWAPDGRPRLCVPPDRAATVRQDGQTILAVLRRAALFARQLATPGPDPWCRYRDPKWTAEGCPCCGGPVSEHELRCGLCAVAVALDLEAPGG